MIELNYILDPAYRRETEEFDLAGASLTDLDFYVFCCDFYFRVDGVNFDARWGWIPIIGMARQLYDAAATAARGKQPPAVWFSESQDEIRFTLLDNRTLEVSTTYASERATMPIDDFLAASRGFLRRVCDELGRAYPALLTSTAFQSIATAAA